MRGVPRNVKEEGNKSNPKIPVTQNFGRSGR